jgi:hypothetical protein
VGWVLNWSSLCGTPTSTATPHPCIHNYNSQFRAPPVSGFHSV